VIVAVLRTRLKPEAQKAYMPVAKRMNELVASIPGYVSHKPFTAPDGERLLYVEFESEDALRAWAVHPEHVQAKKQGREFFSEVSSVVCQVLQHSRTRKSR
jgi:heme-degrading monooxygenase HmoA